MMNLVKAPTKVLNITIFRDQWDSYRAQTGLPYHLFHLSTESEPKCSTYFWVDQKRYRVHSIPAMYFQYSQPTYDMTKSRRNPCAESDSTRELLRAFGRLLRRGSTISRSKSHSQPGSVLALY